MLAKALRWIPRYLACAAPHNVGPNTVPRNFLFPGSAFSSDPLPPTTIIVPKETKPAKKFSNLTSLQHSELKSPAEAMYAMGLMHRKGQVAPPDVSQALYWFTKAAKLGHVPAMLELGLIQYHMMRLDPKHKETAFFWFARAADRGSLDAMWNVAGMLQRGEGTVQSTSLRASAGGHLDSMHSLATLHLDGALPIDVNKALPWLERAAAAGHRGAKLSLARLLRGGAGGGLPANPVRAVALLQELRGEPEADYQLALALRSQDPDQATQLLQQAADKGHVASLLELGDLAYRAGQEAAADQHYRRAAERGSPVALRKLSILWLKSDRSRGVSYLEQAADAGDDVALYNLGLSVKFKIFTFEGVLVVASDPAAGIALFERAAALGHEKAMYNLGAVYERGDRIGQDLEKAREWYERAAARQHLPAVLRLVHLARSHPEKITFVRQAAALGHPQAKAMLAALDSPA